MASKLCVLIFGVAVINFEFRPTEAAYHPPFAFNPPPKPDPWRQKLPDCMKRIQIGMAFKLCALIFGVAAMYYELRPIETMGHAPFHFNPPPKPDPWRQNLPDPYANAVLDVDECEELFDQGLKKDPCKNYCSYGVIPKAIIKDCQEIMTAIITLARNNHQRVKPECATARDGTCKYGFCKSFMCTFKVTVMEEAFGPRRQKHRYVRLEEGSSQLRPADKDYTFKDCVVDKKFEDV